MFVCYKILICIYNPPLFQPKLVYFYVIEVADFEHKLCLHSSAQVSEIFSCYHLFRKMHYVDQDVVVMYTFVAFRMLLFCSSVILLRPWIFKVFVR